jgi:hypothetical protein
MRHHGRSRTRRWQTRILLGCGLMLLASCFAERTINRNETKPSVEPKADAPSITLFNQSIHAIVDAQITPCEGAAGSAGQRAQGSIRPGGRRRIVLKSAGCHDLVARVDDGSVQRWLAIDVRGEAVVDVRGR